MSIALIIDHRSHLDHGLTVAQIAFVLKRFADRDAFFIETVELPAELGTVPCGLHGPIMGDSPVADSEVTFAVRGERKGESRLCERPTRLVRQLSLIAGPDGDTPCVLYTAFGGLVSPQEPFDAPEEKRADSEAFWAEHALSVI
jgi:hypothetical protein